MGVDCRDIRTIIHWEVSGVCSGDGQGWVCQLRCTNVHCYQETSFYISKCKCCDICARVCICIMYYPVGDGDISLKINIKQTVTSIQNLVNFSP